MTPSSSERRGLNVSLPHVLVILGLIFGISVILNFNQKIQAGQSIIAEAERLEVEVTDLASEQAALEATLAYVESEAYVEDWARDDGHFVREGEILVVPLTLPGPRPVATPLPPPPPIEKETWELWWSLFFE